jgi:peptidoglycan/LPS O-acetylase OafA/YrhL
MIISITNAVQETSFVLLGLLFALVVSVRRTKNKSFFPLEVTNELKGLAILAIVLSHVGYFLVSDNRFLQPLSNYAGVGVDLFLVLSGFGLVVSALQKPRTIGQFYLRRLPRIYVPMIIALVIFLLLDGFILHQTYPFGTTIKNLLGLFPKANLYEHIDSPLWYVTFLLVNYFIFPFIFQRRFPLFSAALLALVMWFFVRYIPKLDIIALDLVSFYKLHFLAFPMGMVFAGIINLSFVKKLITTEIRPRVSLILRFCGLVLGGVILYYTYYHSLVGETWLRESISSLVTVAALIIIFISKKINFIFLSLFGIFSFEIYLLHWPLLWRYNFLFGRLSPGLAMLLYLGLFVVVGFIFKRVTDRIFKLIERNHA